MTGMLKQYGLNRESTQNRDEWRQKLNELFPKCTNVPEEEAGKDEPGKEKMRKEIRRWKIPPE